MLARTSSEDPRLPMPHDLLWGIRPAHLQQPVPEWARAELQAGRPVVVRRAPQQPGQVAIGIRGPDKAQRHANRIPLSAIRRCLTPEQLVDRGPQPQHLAVFRTLSLVRPLFEGLGLSWGVTGATAYQLATGQAVLHAGSDLDLLLRLPQPLDRRRARALAEWLQQMPCRVDLQLETPQGGVALGEWARDDCPRVMVKGADGPRLVADPWQEMPS